MNLLYKKDNNIMSMSDLELMAQKLISECLVKNATISSTLKSSSSNNPLDPRA